MGAAFDLGSRYSRIAFALPLSDSMLAERAKDGGAALLKEKTKVERERISAMSGKGQPGTSGKDGGQIGQWPGIPTFLHGLLSKLPSFPPDAPLPDVEMFVERLRRTILPPRPVTAHELDESARLVGSSKRGRDDDHDDIFRQRQRTKVA